MGVQALDIILDRLEERGIAFRRNIAPARSLGV
jgi:hypothetical protein